MLKTDADYLDLLTFAIAEAGSCRKLAELIGAKSSYAVQMWKKNGVAYKYRPRLDSFFADAYERSKTLESEPVLE